MDQRRFGSLDGVRALSILGVIWHHAARGQKLPFAEQAAQGVPLFFAISGFLITTLLLREKAETGTISMTGFYARRSLRIFPLYYTVLVIYVLLVAFVEENADDKAHFYDNLPYYLTYTSNWFVRAGNRTIFVFSWSLATEEQFYLVWPSVERWTRNRWLPVSLSLGLIVLWTLVIYNVVPLDGVPRTMVLSVAPAICFGVLLAHLLYDSRTRPLAQKILALWFMAPASLVGVVLSLFYGPELVSYALMALLVGACVANERNGLAWLLAWRPLASLGRVSYGVYLFNMICINLVEKVTHAGPLVVFPIAVLFTWALAWCSFEFYESRFLALRDRFRWSPPVSAAPLR